MILKFFYLLSYSTLMIKCHYNQQPKYRIRYGAFSTAPMVYENVNLSLDLIMQQGYGHFIFRWFLDVFLILLKMDLLLLFGLE